MFKSVYAKYISTFMLIIFVSFLILVMIVTGMVNSYASGAKEELLTHAAEGAAEFLEARTSNGLKTDFGQMIENTSDDVDRMLRAFAAMDEDMTILLVDNTDGAVVRMITPGGEATAGDAVIPRNVILEVNSGSSSGELQSLDGVFDTAHFFRTAPVYTDDGYACGTVFACASSRNRDELLGVMIKTILIASLWVMLAALVAVYILTERVIGPLKDMSRMAKEFAKGNYAARVRVRGNDEVSELARAFNNMAESISRLELMRNTFVANVSHDLRTPMTTISGFIDNILSGAIPDEKRGYYLELIRTEVQRLARLVTSLLDISRIQAGDRKFDLRPFDICEMARRILISFEAKIEAKHLDVEFSCDEERILAMADYDAIYQILYNLCDNAVKFSREGGKLSVSLRFAEEQRVAISVYNEGEGIAKDDLPYVFERFYKGDKSRGLDKSGAGLGLFIAKTIMDAHHERIWVESEQGKYCCFNFILPLA
ncbi:MAG: HAMP domain-containing histidine kinase [Ruminococcaceae bacterium]|nr:HAMP domain-containing histidine kinase [Oscillospiraceae bacterium]